MAVQKLKTANDFLKETQTQKATENQGQKALIDKLQTQNQAKTAKIAKMDKNALKINAEREKTEVKNQILAKSAVDAEIRIQNLGDEVGGLKKALFGSQ